VNQRGLLAGVVLVAWGAGLAAFVRREVGKSNIERLVEASLRVSPGATYLAVEREGQHVGFSSTTVDTVPTGLQVTDYFVADLPGASGSRRVTAQAVSRLTRALLLREFTIVYEADSTRMLVEGRAIGDSILEVSVTRGDDGPDTSRTRLTAPVFLPSLLPAAALLGDEPEVGRSHVFDLYDPLSQKAGSIELRIAAESVFVRPDSAALDAGSKRWVGVHADTIHAWRLTSRDSGRFDAWVDDLGRPVQVHVASGLTLRRTAYELAFENWRGARAAGARTAGARTVDARRVSAGTLLGSGIVVPPALLDSLVVRLTGLPLDRLGSEADGPRRSGDTLFIAREPAALLRASLPIPADRATRARFARELDAEPLVPAEHPEIVRLARRIRGYDRDGRVVAERMVRWVHDSLTKAASPAAVDAPHVLRTRTGDATEHTALFVALSRAAGIPSRAVSGLIHHEGTFYYHAWPEVFLQRWVPVDPLLGEFPASAAHVRLLVGGLSLRAELARLLEHSDAQVVRAVVAPRP
jgi:transglutaminase-like putative cysteine protease